MKKYEIRPATESLLKDFYGSLPRRSLYSLVGLKDGKPVGVAGVYNDRTRFVLFADFTDKNKRFIIAGYRAVMNLIREKKMTVQVLADPNIEGSERLLKHIGCVYLSDGVYQWAP